MKENAKVEGYRPYDLPYFLATLEEGGPGSELYGCKLLVTNRKTLIWSQYLDGDTRAVVKMYRDRGFISWQREKVFRFRVQREFDSLTFIDAREIPCSRPIFWSHGCSPHFGRYEILATREIENAVRLDEFVKTNGQSVTNPSLAVSYELVRMMHRTGCHHGAMYPRNILVTGRDTRKPVAHIIDMPGTILFPYDITGTKMAWIDLYCLTADAIIKNTDADKCTELLKHYGLSDDAARRFVNNVKSYRPSKLAVNLFRAESETWELLSRFGIHCSMSPRLH